MKLSKETIFELIIILAMGAWTYLNPDLTTLEDKYPILTGLIILIISKLQSNQKYTNEVDSLKEKINTLKKN